MRSVHGNDYRFATGVEHVHPHVLCMRRGTFSVRFFCSFFSFFRSLPLLSFPFSLALSSVPCSFVFCSCAQRMNKMKPIWMRNPREVKDEEYAEFYKSTFKAWDEVAAHTHFSLEGQVEFRALMFVPSVLPYELSRNMFDETSRNMRLYVKRVFINDKFEELLPRWLMFLRGVVSRPSSSCVLCCVSWRWCVLSDYLWDYTLILGIHIVCARRSRSILVGWSW